MRRLKIDIETWPIAGAFTISRGSRTEARVIVATVEEDGAAGRGECVPYARYGESVESVASAIEAQARNIEGGATRTDLLALLQPGAARNALDCALWDLEAKQSGKRAWGLAGVAEPRPVTTAYTLSLGAPDAMEAAARTASARPLLKVKLGGAGDAERLTAVRRGAPRATLIVDANEAWDEKTLEANLEACRAVGVKLIEQPLHSGNDTLLQEITQDMLGDMLLCADESLHTTAQLEAVAERYQAINIKLDKTGGLTEALLLRERARELGLKIMVGCMVGTSLAMAPALLLAGDAEFVDLDGPLLLAKDREPGLEFRGSTIQGLRPDLWG